MDYDYHEDDERDEVVYIWNRVTKRRVTVRRSGAQAEIAKQKYPQNWTIIGCDTCANCGGSWDGNRDCANYCLDVIRGREDPNPEMMDIGEVGSWEEVFSKATDLYMDGKVDALATVTQADFENGWFAPIITSLEYLQELAKAAPSVYIGDAKFHLLLVDMLLEPSRLRKVIVQLVVVRLKSGEVFRMPPKPEGV